MKSKDPKWSVAHLPIGTTFMALLTDHVSGGTYEFDYTVNHTTRNGHRSFVVVTEPELRDRWGEGVDVNEDGVTPKVESFNIAHITRILERGDGGPSFREQRRLHSRPDDLNDLTPQIEQARDKGHRINTAKEYVSLSLADVVRKLMDYLGESRDPGETIDWKKAMDGLYAQTFVKKISIDRHYHSFQLFVVNKKKAKAWFRRNHRRCQANITGFIKAQEKRLKADWDKEMQEELSPKRPSDVEMAQRLAQNKSRWEA